MFAIHAIYRPPSWLQLKYLWWKSYRCDVRGICDSTAVGFPSKTFELKWCWRSISYRNRKHLMNKMARFTIPDNISRNWIKAFFQEHVHRTRYAEECWTVAAVKASVIQGSGLGPASLIVTASDLHSTTPGNRIFKFADNTYLAVPTANSSSWLDEISHVQAWASRNNLKLNRAQSNELILNTIKREKCVQRWTQPPPLCPNIERVSNAKVFILNDRLSATDHVNNI